MNGLIGDDDWGLRALCLTEGHPNWWDDYLDQEEDAVPVETASQRRDRHERAKAICARCPVQIQCTATTDLERDDGIRFGVLLPELRESRSHRERIRYEVLTDRQSA